MTSQEGSPRRRDVLRTGAAAGLLGFAALTGTGASSDRSPPNAASPAQQNRYAYSFGLQQGDRFKVRFRPRDDGSPVTERIPADCLGPGAETSNFQTLVVRAVRDGIALGYEGVFVPGDAIATDAGATTTPERTTSDGDATTPGPEADTTLEGTTAAETTSPGGEATTPGETTVTTGEPTTQDPETTPAEGTTEEAALQEETTTSTPGRETTSADGTTAGGDTTVADAGTTAAAETTTPGDEMTPEETSPAESTPEETTAQETTPSGAGALPQLRIGQWYRVTSSSRCSTMHRLQLERIERRETTPSGR